MPDELTEHAARNRAAWDVYAAEFVDGGERAWASDEPNWGIWSIPERELRVLPDDLAGLDTIELGCGTAYWSAWLARRGARPVGIDNSERQLETARRLQAEHGLAFPLLHASAEAVPLPDGGFDLALSEYGASLWCDPDLWLREAARLLRPGGRLAFLTVSPFFMAFAEEQEDVPAGDRLLRPYFGMRRYEWPGEESVEFSLPYGEWVRVLRGCGFAIEALHEPRPPEGAKSGRWKFVTAEWAHRWPHELIWVCRKTA